MGRTFARWLVSVAAAVGACQAAGAQTATPSASKPFTAAYVFGDSLSDRGNLAEYENAVLNLRGVNFPTPPFVHDSFTNGNVAVQVLAQRLGLTEDPSLFVTGFTDTRGLGLTPGTNYAVAGATAGNILNGARVEGIPNANLASQVSAYLGQASGGRADPNALYTVFIGGNDVRTSAHALNPAYVVAGVMAESQALDSLIVAGAQNILVVNVPNVGMIPEFTTGPADQDAAASAFSVQYNQLLAGNVAARQAANPLLNLKLFDLYTFNLNAMPTLSSMGITNTTDACYTGYSLLGSPASTTTSAGCGPIDPATGQATNISKFEYWDSIHPTAAVHQLYGNALYDFVAGSSALPEPNSWAMLIFGMGAVGYALRRRRSVRVSYAV